MDTSSTPRFPLFKPRRVFAAVAWAALLAMALGEVASGGTTAAPVDSKNVEAAVAPPEQSPLFNLLLQLQFSDKYITPRGMIVRESGLTYQPLVLVFFNAYHGDGFINDVKLFGGVWNDFGTDCVSKHAPFGSDPKTNWTEIDPIAGVSISFAKRFKLEETYTSFVENILDIPTSHHLETKLSFDDTDFLKAFALHPYISYWQELYQKSTDADVPYAVFGPSRSSGINPQPGSSFYFDAGITPGRTFASLGDLKLEAPCRVLLPGNRFYGEYYHSSPTVGLGLYELGLKATLPLKFKPKEAGHWSTYVGVRYMNFTDDNLYELNAFNAPGHPVRDTWQVYGGISVFF